MFANLLISSSATAEPTVSEQTISWPDDGWYQVQDALSFESLCEGGRQCEVPDGTYIVINHTTGERFENVVVNGADSGEGPTVSGNIIFWPDDGWYQVQDARSFESLCEGGSQCEVPDGTYIVINHTSGMRYENVMVGEEHEGGEVSPPANLHMAVYSSLSGELMWDRAAVSENVAYYEVSRNGNLLGTTNGISWFEGQIDIAEQYWEVVAVDGEGGRSEPARYPDSESVDTILSEAEAMAPEILQAFTTTEIDEAVSLGWRMANTARLLSQGIEPVEFQIGQTDVPDDQTDLMGTRFDCDSGDFFAHVQGTYEEKPNGEANGQCAATSGSNCEITLVANACLIDGGEVSGSFRFESYEASEQGESLEGVYLQDYLLASQDDSERNVSMSRALLERQGSLYENLELQLWSSDELTVTDAQGSRSITEQYVRVTAADDEGNGGNYSAWAFLPDELFGGQRLFVAFTPLDYSPENGFAQIGEFRGNSSELDGRGLTLSNTLAQPDTWELVVTVNDTERSTTFTME